MHLQYNILTRNYHVIEDTLKAGRGDCYKYYYW